MKRTLWRRSMRRMRTVVPTLRVGNSPRGAWRLRFPFSRPSVWIILPLLLAGLSGCGYCSGHLANGLGKLQYGMGNYHDAYYEFRRAVIDHPENADFLHNLAATQARQGNLSQAEQTYRQALNTDPAHQPSYHGLARLLKDQGRLAEAQEILVAWADTQPYNAGSHVELAWIQRETGDLAGAEESLRTALQVQPNHPVALAQLGQLYQDTGRHDEAIAMYRRSLHSDWLQPQVQSRLAALTRWNMPGAPVQTAAVPGAPVGHPAFQNRYGSLPPFGQYPQAWQPTGTAASAMALPGSPHGLEPIPMNSALIPDADPAHAPQLGAETDEDTNR